MIAPFVAAVALVGQASSMETTLSWHEMGADDPLGSALPAAAVRYAGAAPAGYKVPAGVYQPRFFAMPGESGKAIRGMIGRTTPTGPSNRAWIDWNGDKAFGKAEAGRPDVSGEKRFGDSISSFSFSRPAAKSGVVRGLELFVSAEHVLVRNTGYMVGELPVNGKPTRVALIDINCNGLYGDRGSGLGDYFALDTSGAGRFDPSVVGRLPALVRFPDGSYYRPRVAKDGSRFRLDRDETPTGTLAFDGAKLTSVDLRNGDGLVPAEPDSGKVVVPEGTYELAYAQFEFADISGEPWQLHLSRLGGKIVVQGGKTTTLEVGPPLKASIRAQRVKAGWNLSLDVYDKGRSFVQYLGPTSTQRPAAPILRIAGAKGKVVKTATFAYG
jgi:hypothetical protein